MRFVNYKYNKREYLGVLIDDKVIELNKILVSLGKARVNSMSEFIGIYNDEIQYIENSIKGKEFETIPLVDVKLSAPIERPRRNVFCLGKNYVEHVKEVDSMGASGDGIPKAPIYFTKAINICTGDMDEIRFSKSVTKKVDYEAELAVVIGKEGINIKQEEAEDYIFGYTIINDVSARDLQARHSQWFKGKSLDTFCPMGPTIVHKREIPFPVELNIGSSVNGEVRQNSNTKNLIFNIAYIISDISKGFTIKPGDIISTGTPSGVGIGFKPEKLLKNGDIVECNIERIGKLTNTVVVE
ncbi:fumarylacetoacetate hydrolase family protein [Clostridium akagii]|uniref:fumarylacetoacetate hydrolase family protein n=1 Tax=Clostridium akagii TaxID=91623 RepID=UPI0004799AB2|nr:fumarylacetoacetate hydrolase family protein [Clostridium akagii]